MESILKLTIEKGPRKGETLEFTSRSTVRIGRVVRGNDITIKDAGISSKHMCIRFDCKWVLSDLGSSNGTFLNDIQLEDGEFVEIKDGDTIKLGEVTLIKVEMEAEEKKKDVGKPPRRGRQKKVLNLNEIVDKKCDVVVKIEEMSEAPVSRVTRSRRNERIVKENEKEVPVKRGGRGKRILQDCVVSENSEEECGQDRENEVNLPSEAVGMSIAAPITRQTRSTRNSKKAEHVDLSVNDSKKEAVPAKRRGRPKRILQDDLVPKNLEEEKTELPNLKEPERVQWGGKPKRILQNDQAAENLDEECIKSLTSMGNSGHENVSKNSPKKNNLDVGKSVNLGEESKADEMDVRTSNIGQKSAENVATSSRVKGKSVNVLEPPDLEKMTLGDWFDYLEVALPKEIHDAAEEMILEIRKNAARVHELRLQHQNAKP